MDIDGKVVPPLMLFIVLDDNTGDVTYLDGQVIQINMIEVAHKCSCENYLAFAVAQLVEQLHRIPEDPGSNFAISNCHTTFMYLL